LPVVSVWQVQVAAWIDDSIAFAGHQNRQILLFVTVSVFHTGTIQHDKLSSKLLGRRVQR